jgi:glutamyl-tRNA synthetase
MERKKRMYDFLYEDSEGSHDPISAWRVVCEGTMRVEDELAPPIEVDLSQVPGDFVIRRRDGLWAYQLAVSIDDIAMGITDIVRARDLLDSTPRQFSIYQTLGADLPRTWHVPLVVNADGERLSKRSKSVNREELEEAGWTPSRFRGACARMWGWREKTEDLTMADLLELWDPTTEELKREEVTFVAPD